jgi:ligand-binding sensor domain-containing protein
MNRIIFTTLSLILSLSNLNGQNVFPQKVDNCSLSQFCLDCGELKATYDPAEFAKILDSVNAKYNFKGGKGQIGLQVLIDSSGKGCVLSHTDASNNQITKDLIQYLNSCKWNPAIDNHKPANSSINVFFKIADDKLTGQIHRVDIDAMNENMSNPGGPEVYNKSYPYKNSLLSSYDITVWRKENSDLPNDMSQICVADKDNNIWYGTYNGFVKFNGKQIIRLDEKNSPFKRNEAINAMAVDSNNIKWVFTSDSLFTFDNKAWKKFIVTGTKINDVYAISCNRFGETLICSDTGLIIIKNGRTNILTKKQVKQLPSNNIFYAFRDKKERLWIGTFEGSIMIDKNNNVVEFNKSETPLRETSITDAAEDDNGNIYFALYAYKSNGQRDRAEEGFAVYSKDGKWTHFNDTNSGLPADHINALFFDKFEKVLWIGTNEAGLVRYDLNNGWENYHNKNSKIPSSYIFEITQDKEGNLYIATFNGMTRLAKK